MSKSTGPILTAGALTWANQTVLTSPVQSASDNVFNNTVRIGVATGLLAGLMFGIEKVAPGIAVALAYTALVTTLLVRINNVPTPLERLLDVVG